MNENEKNSLLKSYSVSDKAIRKLFMDCEKIEPYVLEDNTSIITGLIDTKKIIEKRYLLMVIAIYVNIHIGPIKKYNK
jgi:hypothetical protein